MKEEEEEQANVIFGVEEGTFPEEQAHASRCIGALQGEAIGKQPTNLQYLETALLESYTGLVYTLIRGKVIGYADNRSFHCIFFWIEHKGME